MRNNKPRFNRLSDAVQWIQDAPLREETRIWQGLWTLDVRRGAETWE